MNKYRVAEHRVVRARGRDFLFLAAEKAVFEMDPPTRDLLMRWAEAGERTREEAAAWLAGDLPPGADRDDLFEGLLRRRAVVPVPASSPADAPAPPGPLAHACETPIPLKTLIFHMTDACNLRCTYCYQAEAGGRAEQADGRTPMSRRTAQAAVDFLFEHSGGLDEVVIVFFGGEPLLNFEGIRFVVDRAAGRAEETGKRVNFALTTNGTVLNEEIIGFLTERGIGVTVSMDGPRAVHNRHRRFPDGRPSYEIIEPKVRALLERARARPVTARVTVVEEAAPIREILKHLLGLGFVEAGFAPVTTGHPDFQLKEAAMDRLLEAFKGLSREFVAEAGQGRFFGFSNLIDLLVSFHEGEVMDYPCGAGLGLFSVDPAGRLYLCQRFTGREPFCMGDIVGGFDRERLARFRRESTIHNKEECKTCWARTLCTGGCYHEACVREGSHLKPNLHYCEWIRRWAEVGLQAYCDIAAERPEFLDRLSMSRGHPPQGRN